MSTNHEVASWNRRITSMRGDWASIVRSDLSAVSTWRERLAALRRQRAEHIEKGEWRAGPRTLLSAVGLADLELRLTAGLGWLLRPDGHHGVGDSALRALMADLGHEDIDTAGARVLLEESRDVGRTRADLIVTASTWTLVVEAKVYAGEQERQLDRLHELWSGAAHPVFLYLTRQPVPPTTAVASGDVWQQRTWQTLAALLRAAAAGDNVAPGVHDYIDTLEAYHRVR